MIGFVKVVNVAICDDQIEVAEALKKHVEKAFGECCLNCDIDIFTSGDSLLKKAGNYSVVFLDMEMPGRDGVETGKRIRSMNPECKIIMASCKMDRFKEVFQFQAFRFISKPFMQAEIEEAVFALKDIFCKDAEIEVYNNREPYMVKLKDIQYVEAFNGYSEFHVSRQVFRSNLSLKELEGMLDERFFVRISRQFIVNCPQIDSYKNGIVHISDTRITVSRRKKADFARRYIAFDLYHRS